MNNTLITLRNEVNGLETIDTAWDVITRRFYDSMANTGTRLSFEHTAALDTMIKTLRALSDGVEVFPPEPSEPPSSCCEDFPADLLNAYQIAKL